jgi:hypothetical protein
MDDTAPEPIRIPADEETAVYANDAVAWCSRHDVALDLHVVGPLEEGERPATPVVRLRLPASMVLTVIEQLQTALAAYMGEDGR